MVEVARLESVYRVKPIGGSNPPLSAIDTKAKATLGWLFALWLWRREASPLRGLRGGFEGLPLQGQPAPNLPFAAAQRRRCAPWARFVLSLQGYSEVLMSDTE